ncbi:MAG: CPBP family intramembrane metalloprotease, partial [Clostridiales bacterium]|nr:CPBP family intramembrane metalloprotease [Clostridiales bacterium]
VMFVEYAGIVKALFIILFTGALAFVMGFINEKRAGGSILPGWAIHFISNLFSGILSLFSVL